jgi:DNA-binding MarR family transcriptional regulator
VVLAYLRHEGIPSEELAGLSGQIKQVIGVIVDDLETLGYVERRPDPTAEPSWWCRPTADASR